MMIRTVLAVALAAALLAVSQPAIQQAGRDRTATTVAEEVDRFVERAEDLIDTDDAVSQPGARRIVTLTLPDDRRFAAGVDRLTFEPRVVGDARVDANASSAIAWVIDGGDRHERVLERVRLDTPDGTSLRITAPGRHRLVLSLRGSSANPTVHVRRFDSGGGQDA